MGMLLSKSTQGPSVNASTYQRKLVGKLKKSGNLDVLATKPSKFRPNTRSVTFI